MNSNIYIKKAREYIQLIGQKASALFAKTAAVNINGKKYSFHPVKTTVALIGLIIIVSILSALLNMGTNAHNVDVTFEAGSPYRVYSTGENLMLYNNRGAAEISPSGKSLWKIDAVLSEPLAEADGDYTLLCDLAGNHYAASYKNGKQQTEYNLGNDIISAKITDKGYAVFATDTDGYKAKVTVFNKRGREMYVWNSGGGYITDVELTDNGRYLVAAQMVGDGEEASAKIQFIDTGRGEVVNTAERNGEVVVNLKFVSGNKVIAVTDKNILGYNKKGKELFCISLTGKSPSLYSLDSDELIAVVTLDNRGMSAVEIYNTSGKFCGSYTAEGSIRALTASDKRVVVAEQRGLVSITPKGKIKDIVKVEHDIEDIGRFENGRVIVVGTSKAETINIK